MGSEQRKQERFRCYAKVLFAPTMTPGYIRDLSRTGCMISFVSPIKTAAGETIELQVVGGGPEADPFALRLRVRWTKADGIYFSLGAEIMEPANDAEEGPFAKLVAYYQGTD